MTIDMTSTRLDWRMSYIKDAVLDGRRIESINQLLDLGCQVLKVSVPGNFEIDLENNGIISDPMIGSNVLKVQEYEDCHVIYFAEFEANGPDDHDCNLVFEGLDTFADVYMNSCLLATADNMLIEHKIPVNLAPGVHNEILVHIRPACIEAKKHAYNAGCVAMKYNYESLHVRKAPHRG
jgi:beta-galactosidase/beta-glucuronidase